MCINIKTNQLNLCVFSKVCINDYISEVFIINFPFLISLITLFKKLKYMGIERLKYMGLRVMIEAFKFYNHWTLLIQALSQLNQPNSHKPKALLDPIVFFFFNFLIDPTASIPSNVQPHSLLK